MVDIATTIDSVALRWEEQLSAVSSILGRLEVLSSLRDNHTGFYVHHGMSIRVGERTHDILLKSHEDAFAEWQAQSLRMQMRDLKCFVQSISLPDRCDWQTLPRNEKSRRVIETWVHLEPYRNFVPLSASQSERGTFLAKLTALITVLKTQLTERRQRAASATTSEDKV